MDRYQVTPIGSVKAGDEGFFIELERRYIPALQGLEGFGHLQIIWWFSDFDQQEMRSILEVPQPYQQAPEVMGIFATRSPVRPNSIALTTVQVIEIDRESGVIQIAYIDAHDGTPVLDIKPYIPSLDRVEAPAVPQWCSHWPVSLEASEAFDWEREFNF